MTLVNLLMPTISHDPAVGRECMKRSCSDSAFVSSGPLQRAALRRCSQSQLILSLCWWYMWVDPSTEPRTICSDGAVEFCQIPFVLPAKTAQNSFLFTRARAQNCSHLIETASGFLHSVMSHNFFFLECDKEGQVVMSRFQ